MDQVDGIPGLLPPLAPFPTAETRQKLPPEEWQTCLDAWIFCAEFRLRLLPEHFHRFKLSHASSGISFLSSYFLSWSFSHDLSSDYRPRSVSELKLHRYCLLLLRRLLLETNTPHDYSNRDLFKLLANASVALRTNPVWSDTLQQAWQRQEEQLSTAVEEIRSHVIKMTAVIVLPVCMIMIFSPRRHSSKASSHLSRPPFPSVMTGTTSASSLFLTLSCILRSCVTSGARSRSSSTSITTTATSE